MSHTPPTDATTLEDALEARLGQADMTLDGHGRYIHMEGFSGKPVSFVKSVLDHAQSYLQDATVFTGFSRVRAAELIHDFLLVGYDPVTAAADPSACAHTFRIGLALASMLDMSEVFPDEYPQSLLAELDGLEVPSAGDLVAETSTFDLDNLADFLPDHYFGGHAEVQPLHALIVKAGTDGEAMGWSAGDDGFEAKDGVTLGIGENSPPGSPVLSPSEDDSDAEHPQQSRKKKTAALWEVDHPKLDPRSKHTSLEEMIKIAFAYNARGTTETAYTRHKLAPDWFDKTGRLYPRRAGELLSAKKGGSYRIAENQLPIFGDKKKLNRDRLDTTLFTADGELRKRTQSFVPQGRGSDGKMLPEGAYAKELSGKAKGDIAGEVLKSMAPEMGGSSALLRADQARKKHLKTEADYALALTEIEHLKRQVSHLSHEYTAMAGVPPKDRRDITTKLAKALMADRDGTFQDFAKMNGELKK